MPTKFFIKSICLLLTFVYLTLSSEWLMAKPEYFMGLSMQGLRGASVEEVELGFNYQLSQSTKDKNYSLKVKVFPSNQMLIAAMSDPMMAGYFGPPLLYFQQKNIFNPEQLYSPVLSNKVMQRYLILVRNDAGVRQLVDLKKTDIAYTLTDEVGMFYLQKLLKDKQLGALTNFFNKMTVKNNPSTAISAVFFKEAKATIVLESDFLVASELNPQLKKQLTAIETSPEYITNLLAIKKELAAPMTTQEFQQYVISTGLNIKSRKLLKTYNYNELRKVKERDLDSVEALIHAIDELKGLSK